MRTGIAHLPLHYGQAPAWLFQRMKKLAREITIIIVSDFGAEEFLKRMSDPFWFQSFGCVLGFDWHSSGVTTTVGGALKEGLKGLEKELGLVVAGGKGGTSRKTPSEIETFGEQLLLPQGKIQDLIYASKMSAKVDTSALPSQFHLHPKRRLGSIPAGDEHEFKGCPKVPLAFLIFERFCRRTAYCHLH